MANAGILCRGVVQAALVCGVGAVTGAQAQAPSGPAETAAAPTTMRLQPRYARIYTDPGVEQAEANYQYRELPMDMPLNEAALVCVDCWSWHFSRETLERTEQITRDHIVPLLEACRRQGLLVIHAPADPVASRHPNWVHLKAPDAKPQPPWPNSPVWPPAEFRQKTGAYAAYARPLEPQQDQRSEHGRTLRDFHPLVKPVGDEPVVRDGEELHLLCAQRRILHLFFIGFNTNACVMMRDYGLPAMTARGYTGILVRDCTTGMEVADTLKDLTCTKGTIATIEQFLGYSVTSQQLVQALTSAKKP
jgi:nicotinamidase-related amidase